MNWQTWLYGLGSALIGGAANSIVAAVVAPESFNFNEGLSKLVTMAVAGAIMSAAAYLKQSPLPPKGGTS